MPTTRRLRHRLTGASAIVVTIVAFGVLGAAPASAHVNAGNAGADAAGATTVTFAFDHGCDESPTTSLRVQLPEGASGVTATKSPSGWTATVTATEVTWKGGPPLARKVVPEDFAITATLVGAVGDTVYFPTIQGCEVGEELWLEKSPDPSFETAAPRIKLTVAGTAPTTTQAPTTTTTTTASSSTPSTTASTTAGVTTTKAPTPSATGAPTTTIAPAATSTSSNLPIILGVVAAVVILGGLATVLLRARDDRDDRDDRDG